MVEFEWMAKYKDTIYTRDEIEALQKGIWFDYATQQYLYDDVCPHCQDGPVYVTGTGAAVPGPAKTRPGPAKTQESGVYVACRCGQDHPIEGDDTNTRTSCGRSVRGLNSPDPVA